MPPETSPALQAVGNYDLVEKIAEGGMGSVYRGRHRTTGDIVAVKLLAAQMASNPTYLQRFEKEYNAAQVLAHPNIVRALEYGVAAGQPYLVMEFVDGESLGQRLEREGRVPEAEAIRIIVEAAQGLQRAHKQGLIHRDVKPDNIMLTRDGEVKLADLGLVKELDGDLNLTRTGRGLGTPHFMAPEQFRNAKNADVRCDIYSLGATLYMMVTGQMPFAACPPLEAWVRKNKNDLPAPRKVVRDLSERTDWAIRRAMDANPDCRPQTCKEFVDDLTGNGPLQEPWWYVQYTDDQGKPHLVKGRLSGIRRSLQEGKLGDTAAVRIARAKNGTYSPLRDYAELRDLAADTPPPPTRLATPTTPLNLPLAPTDPGTSGLEEVSSSGPVRKLSLPHNPLDAVPSQALEWLKLIALIGAAVGIGVITALLFAK
jgi:serine/threonine protein kinase